MDLYILRHGIAEDAASAPGLEDSQRRLTAEGVKKMRRVAEGMKAAELQLDLIVTSPYTRARQTAEIVADVLKLRQKLEISPLLTPESDPAGIIQELKGEYAGQNSLMLVGHEPCLSRLISFLLSGNTGLAIALKKGGLCKLTVGRLKPGPCAMLEWLLTPGQARGL
jgi:phosphohistidine phosphatase